MRPRRRRLARLRRRARRAAVPRTRDEVLIAEIGARLIDVAVAAIEAGAAVGRLRDVFAGLGGAR